MIIAVTYEKNTGQIFQHFGMTPDFRLYTVEDNRIISIHDITSGGYSHGALAAYLADQHVDILLCGGLGQGAVNHLTAAGIRVYGGVTGSADQAVSDFLQGKLVYDPQAALHHQGGCCSHH